MDDSRTEPYDLDLDVTASLPPRRCVTRVRGRPLTVSP